MAFTSEKNIDDLREHRLLNDSLSEWQLSQLSKVSSNVEAKCLLKKWYNNSYNESLKEIPCPILWDGVHCWPPIPPGSVINKSCTEIFQETHPQYAGHLKGFVKRECLRNGSWAFTNESDYVECTDSFELYLDGIQEEDDVLVPMVHHMLFFGSILSLICLGISLAIFYYYRSLWCDRVTVRVHLMLSLVLRFVLMFIITEPFVIGHDSSYRDVEILCESILVVFLYSTFASVSWMFIQGLYLTLSLTVGGLQIGSYCQLAIYYSIGWGVPAVFVVIYVIFMLLKDQESCWKGYSEMKEIWILMGPMSFQLVVNGLFLINILRVLLKKVRNSQSRPDSSQIKAAAKATAILFPVLGMNNLILLHNPGGDYNKYFVTLNTFFSSTQGIFVAIVYCFVDKDVRSTIQRSIQRQSARRNVGESNPTRNTNLCRFRSPVTIIMEMFTAQRSNQSGSNKLESAV